jgi:hypothetical protein
MIADGYANTYARMFMAMVRTFALSRCLALAVMLASLVAIADLAAATCLCVGQLMIRLSWTWDHSQS